MEKVVNRGLFSSAQHTWETQDDVYTALDQEFHFTLDPSAQSHNAKAPQGLTAVFNGLSVPWTGTVFCNPPYGRQIGTWVEKAYREAQAGSTVVLLIPSRTDTRWWHEYVMRADEIRFLKGRLYFTINGHGGRAPFPSCVVVFRGAHGR